MTGVQTCALPIFEAKKSCSPTFNLKYRWAYIVFTWVIVSLILNSFSALLRPVVPASNFYREFAICGGQIVFQSVIVGLIKNGRLIHYLGNMMTVSLAGASLLLPALLIAKTGLLDSPIFYLSWFLIVVGFMTMCHMRRVKLLGMHWGTTVSWIIYRFLILLIIL